MRKKRKRLRHKDTIEPYRVKENTKTDYISFTTKAYNKVALKIETFENNINLLLLNKLKNKIKRRNRCGRVNHSYITSLIIKSQKYYCLTDEEKETLRDYQNKEERKIRRKKIRISKREINDIFLSVELSTKKEKSVYINRKKEKEKITQLKINRGLKLTRKEKYSIKKRFYKNIEQKKKGRIDFFKNLPTYKKILKRLIKQERQKIKLEISNNKKRQRKLGKKVKRIRIKNNNLSKKRHTKKEIKSTKVFEKRKLRKQEKKRKILEVKNQQSHILENYEKKELELLLKEAMMTKNKHLLTKNIVHAAISCKYES